MIRFIFSKKFLINLTLAMMLVGLALTGSYFFLANYTRPDAVAEVPSVIGFDILEAEAVLKNANLQGVVIDSIYLKGKPGGEIVQQDPEENASVKENRKIYLTITRFNTPMVKLPNVMQSLSVAISRLKSYGFMDFEITSKPSECTDCVIDVLHRGKSVKPGTNIPKGAKLTLVVGAGQTGELIFVPVLNGLNASSAETLLQEKGLNLGAAPCADCATAEDSARAVIYRQIPNPENENMISVGSSIDVFLTSDSTLIPVIETDSNQLKDL
jgi:eukaryotic-like serine/threonine-protein kinase